MLKIYATRQYKIKIKDLSSNVFLNEELEGTSGDMAWSSDGKFLFYVMRDSETLLPFQVYRHRIGDMQSKDKLIFEETDPTYHVSVGNSRSMEFVEIDVSSTTSSEVLLIAAEDPLSTPKVFFKRIKNKCLM